MAMKYTPVFVIADEDLWRWRRHSVRMVLRDYAESERATIVLTGPLDGLGVRSKKRRVHTANEIKAIAAARVKELGVD